MHISIVLTVVALFCSEADSFDLNNLLRRLRPGINRNSIPKIPQLFVPLKGQMKWELTSPPTTLMKLLLTRTSTEKFTTTIATTTPSTTIATTTPTTSPTTTFKASPTLSAMKFSTGLNLTECNKYFIPEFVAILSNNSFGRTVLEKLGIPQTQISEDDIRNHLQYTDCQAAFLPDFVAILTNSTVGQEVLENMKQLGLVSFRVPKSLGI